MASGFDTYINLDEAGVIDKIKPAGYDFVARYAFRSTRFKQLVTKQELLELRAAGVYTIALFEQANQLRGYFSYQQGVEDGLSSAVQWQSLGMPTGETIYVPTDFDATHYELSMSVLQYYEGLADGMEQMARGGGELYSPGVYGSGLACSFIGSYVQDVSRTWLASSTGWSGSLAYAKSLEWNVKQSLPTKWEGIDIDPDETQGDGGGWFTTLPG